MSCHCFHNQDTGHFEPCCQQHELEYVAYLERISYENHGVCVFCCVRPCECIEWSECLRCQGELCPPWVALCRDCADEEVAEEYEHTRGPQTLADVGMCEADFR